MMGKNTDSVFKAFEASATKWPARDAITVLPNTAAVYGIQAGSLSYASVLSKVKQLYLSFVEAGYSKGMRVAILLENRPDFFIHWLALNRLGASIVPINPDLRSAELEYLIGHAEPALIVALSTRVEDLQKAANAAKVAVQAISPGTSLPAPREHAVVAAEAKCIEQEAAVLYTSGTTGKPKGCVLSNEYYLMAGNWYAAVGGIAQLNTDGERMITPLPVFHMNAMAYSFMAMVTVGGCLTVLDRFHPSTWWQDVHDSQATCLHYLGVMPTLLMKADCSSHDRSHRVRFGFGAGVDPKLQNNFEERFGFPLVEAWAMTETGAGAVIAASTTDRLTACSCLGTPAADIEYRLVDDQGNDVEQGMPGELLVRHAGDNPRKGFFSSYYKNPQATHAAWKDNWFHTGDILRTDEKGRLYFIDREKNLIRRSGENIAAVEVESILMRHPDVQAAAVTPVPDELRGDEVFACIKVDKPSEQMANAIGSWCLEQMAYYKAPGYIAFVNELPLTSTQKIQRAQLQALALQLLKNDDTYNTTAMKKRQKIS